MGKSQKGPWKEPFEFTSSLTSSMEAWEQDGEEDILLDEAHDALSRLLNRTEKRERPSRGHRRAESWN